MVDTGSCPRAVPALRKSLDGMDRLPLSFIVHTHSHFYHIAGDAIADDETMIIDIDTLDSLRTEGVLHRNADAMSGRTGEGFETVYTLSFQGKEVGPVLQIGVADFPEPSDFKEVAVRNVLRLFFPAFFNNPDDKCEKGL